MDRSRLAAALLCFTCVATGCSTTTEPDAGQEATDTGDDGDGPDAFVPFARSGTRIEFRGYRVGGFESVWQTWDTELGIECTPGLTTEGKARCLPQAASLAFSSSDCAGPPVFWTYWDTCTTPEYTVLDADSCPEAAAEAYTLSPIPVPDEPLYHEVAGDCQPLDIDVGMVFSEGEPIPLDTFASGELVTEVAEADVGVEVWQGDDGSRRVMRMSWEGAEAWVHPTKEGERLMPEATALAGSSLFADPSCSGDNAAAYWSTCTVPTHATQRDFDAGFDVIYEVGEATPGWELRTGEETECVESTFPQVFALGAEVDPSMFPEVNRRVVPGSPVDVEIMESATGVVLHVGIFELGETRCIPQRTGDSVRCIATDVAVLGDDLRGSDCVSEGPRVHLVEEGQAPGDLVRGEQLDSCSPEGDEYEWFRIGDEYEGIVVQLGPEGACELYLPPGPVHVLEPTVPDEYPELTWATL